MSGYSGPEINESDLILYFDAANRKSYPGTGNNIIDLSTYKNNGIAYGNTYYDNNTLVFDGIGDYIEVTHSSSLNLANQLTVSVWVSGSESQGRYDSIVGKTSNINWTDGWGMYFDEDAETYYIAFFVNQWDLNFAISRTDNKSFPLTNFVGTYDGSNVKMYKNGELVDQKAHSNNIINVTQSLFIMTAIANYDFAGNLHAASIYSRAFTASEVQQSFNALRGRFGI